MPHRVFGDPITAALTNSPAFPRASPERWHNAAMRQDITISRRHAVLGLSALAVAASAPVQAQTADLVPDGESDQTAALQAAIDGAVGKLTLPAGRFRVGQINLKSNFTLEGVPGATWLVASGGPALVISNQQSTVVRDIGFTGNSGTDPLFGIETGTDITVERCHFTDGSSIALGMHASSVRVRDCVFLNHADCAIHSLESTGSLISGNHIDGCGNAGIRIWRDTKGVDGSIVTNNRIANIDWKAGGNGQNGNGINVYLADEVIVSDNHISDCAFTAVRLNTTKNTVVSGNQCRTCGEVAIFSEFGFSGSIIAENLIDGCSIPTWAAPIRAWAHGFARMATGKGLDAGHAAGAQKLFDAATRHPLLVAGTGQLDTLVMEAFGGRVMQKGGAEGVQCGAIRDKGLGYALKCDDGNMAASQAMVAALLLKFAEPNEGQRKVLESFARQPTLNVRKMVVGEMRAVL